MRFYDDSKRSLWKIPLFLVNTVSPMGLGWHYQWKSCYTWSSNHGGTSGWSMRIHQMILGMILQWFLWRIIWWKCDQLDRVGEEVLLVLLWCSGCLIRQAGSEKFGTCLLSTVSYYCKCKMCPMGAASPHTLVNCYGPRTRHCGIFL